MAEPEVVIFQTQQDIQEHIRRRETEVALLPIGPIRQAALLEISKLRMDAVAQMLLELGRTQAAGMGPCLTDLKDSENPAIFAACGKTP